MKKIICAFLAPVLVSFSMIAGCAAKQTSSGSSAASASSLPAVSSSSQGAASNAGPTQTDVVPDASKNAYSEFYSAGKPAFIVPGLKEGLVPQGMCYVPSEKYFVISYYLEDKSPSVLAVVDAKSGKLLKSVNLSNEDGTPYNGHAGGVAASDRGIWVMSDGVAHRIQITDLNVAPDLGSVKFTDHFQTPTRASLGNCVDGVLWIGDFYTAGGSYNTDESHHMTAPDGSNHFSWVVGYKLDSSAKNELSPSHYRDNFTEATPDYILSIPSKIQGMTRLSSGEFILSESYGRKNDSHLLIYPNVLKTAPAKNVKINDTSVPLWFLDDKVLAKSITAPPMTESIESMGQDIYVLFESGASIYRDTASHPMDELYQLSPLSAAN